VIWNRDIPKQSKAIIYKVYFKSILTFTTEKQALRKRNNSKIQATAVKFLRSTEVKTRWNRIRN
jgi:hypothetical protein